MPSFPPLAVSLWRVIVGRLSGPSGGTSPYTCKYDVATASVLAQSGSAGSVAVGDARGKYGEVGIPRPVRALLR